MDQKWILVILVFCQNISSGAGGDMTIKEGQPVKIDCVPHEKGSLVIWFRLLDTSGVEFIGSFTNNGVLRSPEKLPKIFRHSNSQPDVLTLESFNKTRDSGAYNCASLRGTEMKFGKTTRLAAEKVPVEETSQGTEKSPCTTASPCVCDSSNKQGESSPQMFCDPIILGPLAGACGLLLHILIVIIVYCNHVRTRRCPHHYKRKPRVAAPGKQMMTNRHV